MGDVSKDEILDNLNENITKEKLKEIFDLGILYKSTLSNDNFVSGTMPKNYSDALDYAYRFAILNERDDECLNCGRYVNKSCNGTVNRHREIITEGNRCAAFYDKNKNK